MHLSPQKEKTNTASWQVSLILPGKETKSLSLFFVVSVFCSSTCMLWNI